VIKKAADKKARDDAKKGGATLQSTEAQPEAEPAFEPDAPEARSQHTAESVFGSRD